MSYSLIKADNYKAPPGQIEWTSIAGTYTWIVPRGVFAISAVVIGGGGGGASSSTAPACGGSGGDLVYGNVMSVTPGEQLTIVVGGGGSAGLGASATGGAGGESYILQRGVRMISAAAGGGGPIGVSQSSGKSGTSSVGVPVSSWYTGARASDISFGGLSPTTAAASSQRCTGGGAAAGYGDGGANLGSAGVNQTSTSASSTTGGGSAGVGALGDRAGGGGGTGPWGQGSNGTGVSGSKQSGIGGSGGLPYTSYLSIIVRTPTGGWSAGGNGCMGGLFGGGGGGGNSGNPGTAGAWGARGCVRIIWGDGRQFPSYKAGNVDTTDTVVASSQQNYTTPGTYSWVVPTGVYDFSAVCIGGGGPGLQSTSTTGKSGGGGGGLAYANFECVPGETLTVVAGAGGQSTGVNTKVDGENSTITRNVSFKGFISGTNLFITEIISGIIQHGFGLTITGAGVTSCSVNAFQTGEQGKEGTYTVSVSQTVGSLASPITFSGTLTLITANGGTNSGGTPSSAGGGGSVSGVAKGSNVFSGGSGGQGSTSTSGRGQGGGGAAGYGGNGANASNTSASAANGVYPTTGGGSTFPGSGASGANSGATALGVGAGGGGVGLYGWGKDPNIDNFTNTSGPAITGGGFGGSGGTNGTTSNSNGAGGTYGGGGGGAGSYSAGRSAGGPGAVRITWGRMTYPGPTVDV